MAECLQQRAFHAKYSGEKASVTNGWEHSLGISGPVLYLKCVNWLESVLRGLFHSQLQGEMEFPGVFLSISHEVVQIQHAAD